MGRVKQNSSSSSNGGASVTRLRAIVRGRVQGVGFRYWTHHATKQFDLRGGIVRNLPDGSVEVIAEAGEKAPLEALFTALHRGPATAQVTAVEPEWEENAVPRYAAFRVAES